MPDPTMHCHLSLDAILDHMRLMHPDVWDGTVVVDSTMTPADFGGAE